MLVRTWTTVPMLAIIAQVLVTISIQVPLANGANILGIFLSSGPSHLIVHMSMIKTLAEKGHNVTVITTLKPKVMHESIHNIIIPPTVENEKAFNELVSQMASQKNNVLSSLGAIFGSVLITAQFDALKDKRMVEFYENPGNKFDLVVLGYVLNDFQLAIAARFNCPIVLVWSQQSLEFIDDYVANPRELAYVPNIQLAMNIHKRMNFLQRVKNFISGFIIRVVRQFFDYTMERYYVQLVPSDNSNFPTYSQMKNNVTLVFCNGHFSERTIRPNVPAIIEIVGIQIKEKPDPLPKDIADFLVNSKQRGAVLFSLGSMLQASNVKPEIVQIIFKTLSKLKENVIWKWDDLDSIPGKSKNILYKKWIPQDDILAHPEIKLFITHAGKGGIVESQYHGVPMVALPVFGDQSSNANVMVQAGYGLQINLLDLTEDGFLAAVNEVLNNPVYANNVRSFSELYRDRPLTAKENVVYWSEYVIRHHGAKHLQSPLVHMNIFQSFSLDVIAFLFLILYITLRLLVLGFKLMCKIFKKSKSKVKKTAQQKLSSKQRKKKQK